MNIANTNGMLDDERKRVVDLWISLIISKQLLFLYTSYSIYYVNIIKWSIIERSIRIGQNQSVFIWDV